MSDGKIIAWVVGVCLAGFAVAVGVMLYPRYRPIASETALKPLIIEEPIIEPPSVPASQAAPTTLPMLPATAPIREITSQPAKQYMLRGAAWLNRENGSSDLMRGMPVTLMRREISRTSVLAAVAEMDEVWQREWITSTEVDRSKAARRLIEELRSTPSDRMDALDAYLILAKISRHGVVHFNSCVSDSQVAGAFSNVDGRFAIKGVLPGLYYLHAVAGAKLFVAEWLIPIEVTDKDMEIDLFNGNAINIQATLK